MSDELLRDLERRAVGGDPAARVQLLAERVRAGILRRDRLRVAAQLGDRAALEALGEDLPKLRSFEERARAVAPFGKKILVRVAVAMARLAYAESGWARSLPDDLRFARALQALDAHVLGHVDQGFLQRHEHDVPSAARTRKLEATAKTVRRAVRVGSYAIESAIKNVALVHEHAGVVCKPERAIRSEVVPWVLGGGDPVLGRANAPPDRELDAAADRLLERVREGSLTRERLELAAFLDDPTARHALHLPPIDIEHYTHTWIQEVRAQGVEVCFRAALATIDAAVPYWREYDRWTPEFDRVREFVRDWVEGKSVDPRGPSCPKPQDEHPYGVAPVMHALAEATRRGDARAAFDAASEAHYALDDVRAQIGSALRPWVLA